MNVLTKAAFGVVVAGCFLIAGCKDKGAEPAAPKGTKAAAAKPAAAPKAATKQAATKPMAAKPALAKAPKVKPAAKALDGEGRMQFSEGDRCPVCGMAVSKHKKFASAIELKDGKAYYFCGTGCMIKSWLHPEVFIASSKEQLKRAVTPEYFAGKYVDALAARWVAGSDVVGPMGPALVPLKDDADLATFKKRHGGKATFKLGELDDATWEAITGKKATMRPRKM